MLSWQNYIKAFSSDTGRLAKIAGQAGNNDAKIYYTFKTADGRSWFRWHTVAGMTRQKRKMHFSVCLVCIKKWFYTRKPQLHVCVYANNVVNYLCFQIKVRFNNKHCCFKVLFLHFSLKFSQFKTKYFYNKMYCILFNFVFFLRNHFLLVVFNQLTVT